MSAETRGPRDPLAREPRRPGQLGALRTPESGLARSLDGLTRVGREHLVGTVDGDRYAPRLAVHRVPDARLEAFVAMDADAEGDRSVAVVDRAHAAESKRRTAVPGRDVLFETSHGRQNVDGTRRRVVAGLGPRVHIVAGLIALSVNHETRLARASKREARSNLGDRMAGTGTLDEGRGEETAIAAGDVDVADDRLVKCRRLRESNSLSLDDDGALEPLVSIIRDDVVVACSEPFEIVPVERVAPGADGGADSGDNGGIERLRNSRGRCARRCAGARIGWRRRGRRPRVRWSGRAQRRVPRIRARRARDEAA